jgi:hypothetical protein
MLSNVHASLVQEEAHAEQPHGLQDPDHLASFRDGLRQEQEEADLQMDRLAAEQVIMPKKTLAVQTYSRPDSDTFLMMSSVYDLCSMPEYQRWERP